MASPQQTDDPSPGHKADYHTHSPRPVLRLRLVPWDVICAVAGLATLAIVATTTGWHSRLFGFLNDVCTGDDCPPVPYGVDFYIYPVVWGGIGAAIAAAVIGPVISLLKGWYLSFWPLLAIAIVVFSSVAGSILTSYSEPYWHMAG
jgi:di/tricarboxylate transporter